MLRSWSIPFRSCSDSTIKTSILYKNFFFVKLLAWPVTSWGHPNGKPVLLVHGREDSAATFIPLLELMPADYHYVAVDLPGHGKSDPFPVGVILLRVHCLAVLDITLKHLGWDQFIYIGHSLGSEQGLFYNAIYPNKIVKLILLDPGLAFNKLLMVGNLPKFYSRVEDYYSNYASYTNDTRVYTKRRAMEAVKKARGLTDDQAEIILSRNLQEIGPDMFKLSWDKRLKTVIPLFQNEDYYLKLFTKDAPPTLLISANHSFVGFKDNIRETVENFFQRMSGQRQDFFIFNVDGGHDVHFTNPERLAKEVKKFLNKDFECLKAKL